ncbi:MAG TPA: hypothetical protein VGO62_17735 [Myxococcota bacterium]|jgi:hypothetical protein
MTRVLAVLTLVFAATLGCPQTPDVVDAGQVGHEGEGEGEGAAGEGEGAVGEGEGEGVADAGIAEDGSGCVTFAGASSVCGGASTGDVCAFSLGCGHSDSLDQCSINCEMAATVTCYKDVDVACLEDATNAADCTALAQCAWIL